MPFKKLGSNKLDNHTDDLFRLYRIVNCCIVSIGYHDIYGRYRIIKLIQPYYRHYRIPSVVGYQTPGATEQATVIVFIMLEVRTGWLRTQDIHSLKTTKPAAITVKDH